MHPQAASKQTKPRRLRLLIGAIILIAGAMLVFGGINARILIEHGLAMIRTAGPWVFFSAMALLPALGAPVMTFLLTAGPIFGDRLGMGLVLVLSLGAITVNFILAYLLAKYVIHALVERLTLRFGYSLPKVEKSDTTDLAIIVRVTPGIPFFVQNYLLGLAGVPFLNYILVSCPICWSYATAFVLFGDALLHGKGKIAIIAGGLLIAATATTHLIRKHYAKRNERV